MISQNISYTNKKKSINDCVNESFAIFINFLLVDVALFLFYQQMHVDDWLRKLKVKDITK